MTLQFDPQGFALYDGGELLEALKAKDLMAEKEEDTMTIAEDKGDEL